MRIFSNITTKTTKKSETSFLDLPSREQKKIVKEATKRANQDQLKLVMSGSLVNFKQVPASKNI